MMNQFFKKIKSMVLPAVLSAALIVGSAFIPPVICAAAEAATGSMYGDLDRNGSVEAADALTALIFSVRLEKMDERLFIYADVDGDKQITAADALTILLYSVGKITRFPAEPIDERYDSITFENDIINVFKPHGGVWYPRMITLPDGTIICGFDTNEDGGCCKIKVVRSTDGGLTWQENAVTAASVEERDCSNAAFAMLGDGGLLCAFRCNANVEGGYYSSIRAVVSYDGGLTWRDHSVIFDAGVNENGKGVYEPHFCYVGDKLTVMYADDRYPEMVVRPNQQNIMYSVFDGSKWSEPGIASDGILHNSRDGMPVWDELQSGGYAMVIESTVNYQNNPFVIQLMTSDDAVNWTEPKTVFAPRRIKKKAGAPYVVTLPDGRIAVSFQTDEDSSGEGDGLSCMKVIFSTNDDISSLTADDFTNPVNVFNTPDGAFSAWNGMMVSGEYLYMYTSTNEGGDHIALRRAHITKNN